MNKYKRRQLTAVGLLVLAVISFKGIGKAEEKVIIENYTVKQGDTLWSISKDYKSENIYILDYMDDIRNLNKNSLDVLQVGQEIKVINMK